MPCADCFLLWNGFIRLFLEEKLPVGLRIGMFADKFKANNRTHPSRERRPRRSVGF